MRAYGLYRDWVKNKLPIKKQVIKKFMKYFETRTNLGKKTNQK